MTYILIIILIKKELIKLNRKNAGYEIGNFTIHLYIIDSNKK